MIASLKNWFQALSLRERVLIAILGLLIVAIVGYYAIIRPLSNGLESAEEQFEEAVKRQARIEAKVAALTERPTADFTPVSGALEPFVSQSAGEAGFAVGKLDPQTGGRINMTVESAKSVALFGWLSQLERRGVVAEILSVTPRENGTISASITLRNTARR